MPMESIAAEIRTDTHKLSTTEAFTNGLTQDSGLVFESFSGGRRGRGGFGGASISLKSFVEERQTYLLGLSIVNGAALPVK